MGLALGLSLAIGAVIALMLGMPESQHTRLFPQETGASGPAAQEVPAAPGTGEPAEDGDSAGTAPRGGDGPAAPDAPADGTDPVGEGTPTAGGSPTGEPEATTDEEDNVLLRSVEEEVDTAEGEFRTMEGESEVMGEGPLLTYAVEVEKGLPEDPEDFTAAVEEILGDPRGWTGGGERSVQRVDSDDADIRVLLSAPDTVDRLCAPLDTNGFVSCANGNRAVINQNRWATGVDHFDGDLETYRVYLINHEVGHTLGHGHVFCPSPGEPAPVMQQQTLFLQGCEPNGWVHPDPEETD
ncbi:DUF3152 domain-containing protein [Nocardiopsis sp. LOL_012]|uniref:DUF3152 domain-containing protein n=1 Tax=Nocardiopsis sp. LOL_012 TaxID=3345409 RepID=UPI003A87AEF1